MKQLLFLLTAFLLITVLLGCDSSSDQPAQSVVRPVSSTDLRLTTGQTVYVPAYSEIFVDPDKTLKLTVTLAIHNTDPEQSVVLKSVRYYDTNGQLVRDYLTSPVEVGPLGTAGYVIEEEDTQGGWGANFIVEWGADQEVYEPVIEAVHIGSNFGTSISFISPGRVVSEYTKEN